MPRLFAIALLLLPILATTLGCAEGSPPDAAVDSAGVPTAGTFRIDGRVEGLDSGTITLYRDGDYVGYTYDDGEDTELVDGRFSFGGSVDAPEVLSLELEGGPKIPVFVEPGPIDVALHAGDPGRSDVSGSESHRIFAAFRESHSGYRDEVAGLDEELDAARQAGDAEAILRLEEASKVARESERAFLEGWTTAHSDTFVAPYVAVRHLVGTLGLARLEPLLELFPDELAGSRYLEELRRRHELLSRVAVGKTTPDFELPTPGGDVVAIADFRGKVTLVDFWGAWCGPCRAQNPSLIDLYERFDRDDFEIVGVSIDFDRDAWLGAIEEDGLPWTQMGDVSGFGTEPARLFAIRALPSNVVLGRDGTILAKDVEIDRLPEVIESLTG